MGVGGLFTVRVFHTEAGSEPMPLDGQTVVARGRGTLHRKGALLVGDRVEISYDDTSYHLQDGVVLPAADGTGIAIDRICERTSALIRPPMANLELLFVTFAASSPDPLTDTIDKLISIAEFNRIERGKNTTRYVELYPLSDAPDTGYLADTPGFTMLDFERFDFFEKDDLPLTFREFLPHIGSCRYTKCSHTKEQGCAIVEAVKRGEIARSRHQSFLSLYEVLKKKTKW